MKLLLTLAALLLALTLCAQLQDDFSSIPLSDSVWQYDSCFILENGKLRSNSQKANNNFQICSRQRQNNCTEWEIETELLFNTSSANYCDIYIHADSSKLNASEQAYFIRIGSSSDDICLYRKLGSNSIKLIDGRDARSNRSSNAFRIKVIYDSSTTFSLYTDSALSGYILEGSRKDSSFPAAGYCGITVSQSVASFFKKHYFDNFYAGAIRYDKSPPKIDNIEVRDSQTIRLCFSEAIEKPGANALIIPGIPIHSVQQDSQQLKMLDLKLDKSLNSGEYILYCKNISDRSGNTCGTDSIRFSYLETYAPQAYELLINEIYADPDEGHPILTHEFIELRNNSLRHLQLKACSFGDGSSVVFLPEFILAPDSFLILCGKEAATAYKLFGPCISFSSFPSLNNDGDLLRLRNGQSELLHALSYSTLQYGDKLKEQGGWSLEMIDPSNPCSEDNWRGCLDPQHATPGRPNSHSGLKPDSVRPRLLSIYTLSDSSLLLRFSENLDSFSLAQAKIKIGKLKGAFRLIPLGPLFREALLITEDKFESGIFYALEISGFRDCAGNSGMDQNAVFAVAEEPGRNDVVMNELLFNPVSGGFDYVELYNRSSKVIDLKDLRLCGFDENGMPDQITELAPLGKDLFPGEYLVFSESTDDLRMRFHCKNPEALLKLTELPSLPDDRGTIVLMDANGKIIDSLAYDRDMHYPLLAGEDGVSLEKINPELPSAERSNWCSASGTAGFGTPGYLNSQFMLLLGSNSSFSLQNEVFSPDNDGFEDELLIHYKAKASNPMANILVFNPSGRLVKTLLRSQLLAAEGTLAWNGFDDAGQRLPAGIYVIYIELFDEKKLREKEKLLCVISGK